MKLATWYEMMEIHIDDRNVSEYSSMEIPFFAIGDKVEKRRGYRYPGIVVAQFRSLYGNLRYVVEADNEEFRGMLHIFSPEQLIARKE